MQLAAALNEGLETLGELLLVTGSPLCGAQHGLLDVHQLVKHLAQGSQLFGQLAVLLAHFAKVDGT